MPGNSHSSYFFCFLLFLFYIWSSWQTFSPEWPPHFTVASAVCQPSSFSPSSLTHDVLSVLLVVAILIDGCRYMTMVLTCFSWWLMILSIFKGWLALCVSYKVCVQSCSFLIVLFSYYLLEGSLYIFWMQVLSEIYIVNIFSQSVFCLLVFLGVFWREFWWDVYIYMHIYVYIHSFGI